MIHDSDYKEAIMCWRWFVAFCIAIILIGSLCGCSRNSYTGLQSSYFDSISTVNDTQFDRIAQLIMQFSHNTATAKETIIKDSVVLVLNEAGDTMSKEIVHISDKSVSEQEIITIMQSKIDSILDMRFQQIYGLINNKEQIPVPVEKELTAWQRIKQDYFEYLCALLLVLLVYIFRKPVIGLARRIIEK